MLSFKSLLPWWLKIIVKIVLSRLPLDYHHWNKINLFRHGDIDELWLPGKKFLLHLNSVFPEKPPDGFICLELGPGDLVASGIIAKSMGATKTYLVDVGQYATEDLDYYRRFCLELERHDMSAPDLSQVASFAELLDCCNIEYLTDGIDSLRMLPASSIDFIWSHSVLEHIRRKDFTDMVGELHRIMKVTGKMSHNADLKDHLGGALNNLRFSNRLWESEFMVKSGFYTNRLQHQNILRFFRDGGFEIVDDAVGRWEKMPTPRNSMDVMFQNMPEKELCIRSFHVAFTPKSFSKD